MKAFSSLGWRAGRCALVVTAAAAEAACASPLSQPVGGLELIIGANGLSAPADFDDIRLAISERTSGGEWSVLWNRDYIVPSPEATLPTTFALVAGRSANEEALIEVTAFKGGPSGTPVVQRVAQVQLPTDRVAALWLELARACVGTVTTTGGEAEPASTCPSGQSCQPDGPGAGQCGSSTVDPSTLPTYVPGESLDAGAPTLSPLPEGRGDGGGSDAPAEPEAPIAREASAEPDAPEPPEASAPDLADAMAVIDAPFDVAPDHATGCLIGSTFYASGDANPSNACQTCLPSTSTTAWATASGTACGTACVDLTRDSANCGRCGHSCEGGACSGGVCQVTAFVTGQNDPMGLATDSENLYWTNYGCGNDTVVEAPLAGGTPTTLATGQSCALGIAVNATDVYWTQSGYSSIVMADALPSGSPTQLAADQGGWPQSIAASETTVAWVYTGGPYNTLPPSIMSVPAGGGSATTVATLGSVGSSVSASVAIDSSYVYWRVGTEIAKAHADGSGQVTLVTGQSSSSAPGSLAVTPTHLYWTDVADGGAGAGSVMQANLDGSGVAAVASGQSSPAYVVADSDGVYWTNAPSGDGGTVMMAPLDGGATTTLAAGQANPQGIAASPTAVYFADKVASGTIWRVAKP